MSIKEELTRKFLVEANIPCTDKTIKQYLWVIWAAPMGQSLLLSARGAKFLDEVVKLESYKCQIKSDLPKNGKAIVQMSKYIKSPFHITGKTIAFYGEQDAVMLYLIDGNLIQYLENFER